MIFFIFLIIFQNYRTLEILADLATNRRTPRRSLCATTVDNATAMAHGGKEAANGPLQGAGSATAYCRGPERLELRPLARSGKFLPPRGTAAAVPIRGDGGRRLLFDRRRPFWEVFSLFFS
jgi:hypothetical protein